MRYLTHDEPLLLYNLIKNIIFRVSDGSVVKIHLSMQRHGFDPWSKIPCARAAKPVVSQVLGAGALEPRGTTEPTCRSCCSPCAVTAEAREPLLLEARVPSLLKSWAVTAETREPSLLKPVCHYCCSPRAIIAETHEPSLLKPTSRSRWSPSLSACSAIVEATVIRSLHTPRVAPTAVKPQLAIDKYISD